MRFVLRLLQAVAVVGILFSLFTMVLDHIAVRPFGFAVGGFAVWGGGGGPPVNNPLAQTLQVAIEPVRYTFYNLLTAAILFVLCEIALTLRWHVYRQQDDAT